MAIEFRCTKCGKLLRTGDDTAGKHAKCPECGEILVIPAPDISMPTPAQGAGGFPPPPPSSPAGGSPFEAMPQPSYQPDTGNPYQSPSEFVMPPNIPLPAGEIRPTIIEIGDVFGRAWTIFKSQWAMCLGALIVVGICNAAFGFVTGRLFSPFLPQPPDFGKMPQHDVFNVMLQEYPKNMLVGTIKGYVDLLFTAWTSTGLGIVFLKIARGQQASLGDIFSGGRYYVTMLISMIIFNLITGVGFLLLIVPGIILTLMFGQFFYLIIDRNLGIMESFEMSKTITYGNKLTLFLSWFVSAGIAILGLLACGVGLFAAIPYLTLVYAVIYLTMTGQPTAEQLQYGAARQ